jgi:uncharacterized membrane protein YhaH (DUF805 family)
MVFWCGILANILGLVVLYPIVEASRMALDAKQEHMAVMGIASAAIVFTVLSLPSLFVRRARDLNFRGIWGFLGLLLVVGAAVAPFVLKAQGIFVLPLAASIALPAAVALMVTVPLGFIHGTRGSNRFGPCPHLAEAQAEASPTRKTGLQIQN